MENKQSKIMTKPLPEILDELENYIKRLEEAERLTRTAVKEARDAAAHAKESVNLPLKQPEKPLKQQ